MTCEDRTTKEVRGRLERERPRRPASDSERFASGGSKGGELRGGEGRNKTGRAPGPRRRA